MSARPTPYPERPVQAPVTGGGLAELLRRVRYEVLPAKATEDKVLAHVPADVPVTVTASPAKGLGPTLDLATRLAGHGYRVVPHVPARQIADAGHLADIVDRLVAAGIEDVFVPAGDADPPAGAYDAALPVLRRLGELGSPFAHVGITGYPESHPLIEDDVTVQAMWDKQPHATYIVSNLCFDPVTLRQWLGRVRRRQIVLPVHVGVAGPVERAKLLSMAAKIGVGESAKFLTRHPRGSCASRRQAATTRSGCCAAAPPRSAHPRPRWRGCTCSPSTRSPRPSAGGARCWSAPAAER